MGMTMTQKILARRAGMDKVAANDLVWADVDFVLGNDITAPVAIDVFGDLQKEEVFCQKSIGLVPDHFAPNKDIQAADNSLVMRNFANKHGIENYFEIGQMGIEHVLLPEKGLVRAGEIVIGADSHTCTYGALGAFSTGVGSTDMAVGMAIGKAWFKVPEAIQFHLTGQLKEHVSGKDVILHIIKTIGVEGALYKSMEFVGEGVKNLEMSDRFTIANMAIEAGGKNGIFLVDEKTQAFLKEVTNKEYEAFYPDEDATYSAVYDIDLGHIEPTVAFPHLPENGKTFDEIGHVAIDQVVIGSCTNGRIEDLRVAANLLKNKKVAKGVRAIVIPGTQKIYKEAIQEGLVETFIDAGAVVSTPTCGPCLGGHMGVLAKGERAVATTNRNFVGRMGHPESEVYLASPAVAASSAIMGRLFDPREVGNE